LTNPGHGKRKSATVLRTFGIPSILRIPSFFTDFSADESSVEG